MAKNKLLSALVLGPISILYRFGVSVRNYLFDKGIIKQHEFNVPVVVVGNISMGGSGKTPHTEYIVDALSNEYNIGILSRGYKRKTRGFVLACKNSHIDDIGDEPYQLYRKFAHRNVTLAVCEDRVKGINAMLEANPKINLLVLDDAFQHRYVKPTVAVVLMESTRPAFRDHLLPLGRLREPVGSLNRADIVVVTKCTDNMRPMDYTLFAEDLSLWPYQTLLFSKYEYSPLLPVFDEVASSIPTQLASLTADDTVLVVAGVANPKPFVKHIRSSKAKIKIKIFPDHHHFTSADMTALLKKFQAMSGKNKYIITTEKDAMRLMNCPYFPQQLKAHTYYQPIRVKFVPTHGENKALEAVIKDVIAQKTKVI